MTEVLTSQELRDRITLCANRLIQLVASRKEDFPEDDITLSAMGALFVTGNKQGGTTKEEFLALCEHLYDNLTVKDLGEGN